jgi:hypothetical protein
VHLIICDFDALRSYGLCAVLVMRLRLVLMQLSNVVLLLQHQLVQDADVSSQTAGALL